MSAGEIRIAFDLEKFRAGEKDAFKSVCKSCERAAVNLCASYISDQETQKNIVSEAFYLLYHARASIASLQDISTFLSLRINQLAGQPNSMSNIHTELNIYPRPTGAKC